MTRAKELLDATSLQDRLAEQLEYHLGDVVGGDPDWSDFANRLVAEVGLPAYEAAVKALESIAVCDRDTEWMPNECGDDHHNVAREALRRLQEQTDG